VLLGLARGSGGRSLAGMRRRFECYRRPLLDVARADTEAACRAEGLDVWDDPHNEDPRYARVRVRRRVLPVLEAELGPGIAATLARTADQLRDDMGLLDDLAEAAYAELAAHGAALPVVALTGRPTPVRRRVLRLAALAAGSPPSELFHEHVLALDALLTDWHGQRWVDLPGHVRGSRSGDELVVERVRPGPG
jgi:tRNA(Ile)-lysidine synthase